MPALQMRTPSDVQIPLFPAPKFGVFSKPILRARQRPFRAPANDGPYRLPKAALDRLEASLAPFRNAEAAFALAVFLARFWTAPNRLGTPFPVDRRALTGHQALELSEGKIRGALNTLERVGFLNRPTPKNGSRYQPTAEGLHRKPILFEFGADFVFIFQNANQKAERACERRPAKGHLHQSRSSLRSVPFRTNLPKKKFALEEVVLMGRLVTPSPEDENSLERSFARLAGAMGINV